LIGSTQDEAETRTSFMWPLLLDVLKPDTSNDDMNVTLLINVVNPLTFENIESPPTFNANITGGVVFIPKPDDVIIKSIYVIYYFS
jgi:hypothetical protein